MAMLESCRLNIMLPSYVPGRALPRCPIVHPSRGKGCRPLPAYLKGPQRERIDSVDRGAARSSPGSTGRRDRNLYHFH